MQEEKKVIRKRLRESEFESKQLAEEEYNREIHEQRYKRLMHLLNKSQFYSSFLVNKIGKQRNIKKGGRAPVNNENIPPSNKRKSIRKQTDSKKYNVQEYIFPEVSNEKNI